MICVSIGRGRHQQMIAEHGRLVTEGIPLVELRLDFIRREVNIKRLLENRPGPVIVTCRRESEGGQWKGTEEQRLVLLRAAIVAGSDYVDLESDVAGRIPRFGPTKRIISCHNFHETPTDLASLHAQLCAHDPDIVKLATAANCPHDNLRMLKLIEGSARPTVAFCLGEMGLSSRLLCGKFGAPFTYAAFSPERSMAPGQISYKTLRELYNYDEISADTAVYGVVADPVAHSHSPVIHNAAFRACQLNCVYLPFRVPVEDLNPFLEDAAAFGVRGLSVTIPHKEAALAKCDRVDGAVRGIGAVNTLMFDEGHITGFNTDYRAAMNCLDLRLNTEERSKPLAGRVASVLGAGGVARAFVFGLHRRGADVVVTSRKAEKADRLAKAMKARHVPWERRLGVKADVIVNATPVGMHPNVDETPFDMHSLRPNTIVFETVYNPEQTLFYKQARQRQCRVISGVEMFIAQAALQFRIFTGQDAPVEVMHEQLRRTTGAAQLRIVVNSGQIGDNCFPFVAKITVRRTNIRPGTFHPVNSQKESIMAPFNHPNIWQLTWACWLSLVATGVAQDALSLFHRGYYLQHEAHDLPQALDAYDQALAAGAGAGLQAQIRDQIGAISEDIASRDLAGLMPPETIIYAEISQPGRHMEQLIRGMGLAGRSPETPPEAVTIPLGNGLIMSSDFQISPALLRELGKAQGMALGITGINPRGPEGVLIIHPGESDIVRGLIETGLQVVPHEEAVAGFPTFSFQGRDLVCAHPFAGLLRFQSGPDRTQYRSH